MHLELHRDFSGYVAGAEADFFNVGLEAAQQSSEPRITVERLRGGPRPLNPLLNQLAESRSAAQAALAGVARKLRGGPGAYEGMWELLARTYGALAAGVEPPVTIQRIEEVNRLVAELDRVVGPA